MSNLKKIENIKSTLDSLKNIRSTSKGLDGVFPIGERLELQSETQIIIAEELIKANDSLSKVNMTLESIEAMISSKVL